jgi:hypothetical protein
MDLEGFYDVEYENDSTTSTVSFTTAAEALKWLDQNWYTTRVARGGRWMDLIGDYAGSESFIIDGTIQCPAYQRYSTLSARGIAFTDRVG